MGNRRDFIKKSAGVGAGAALGVFPRNLRGAPAVIIRRVTPTCVASANGLGAVSRAIEELANGTDTIEAIVRGVNLVEEDPSDTSVGYGGLPNQDGVVQLDSSLMHGPTRGAGAVAAIEGVKRPSLVALDVMRYTDHHLLVGEGANIQQDEELFSLAMKVATERVVVKRSLKAPPITESLQPEATFSGKSVRVDRYRVRS